MNQSNDYSLTLVTAKTAYPVSASEMKAQLNINDTDTSHDTYITALIEAATEIVEKDTQLILTSETWKYTFPDFYGNEIVIPRGPIASITHVKYYDTGNTLQTLTTDAYTFDGASGGVPRGNSRIYLNENYDWPSVYDRKDAVQITFVGGYGAASAVPESLKHAIKLLCTFWFEHRGEPVGSGVRMHPAYDALVCRFVRSTYP